MFKIGQRYTYKGNKCTVCSLKKEKTAAKIRYDNLSLGHDSSGSSDYDYDDYGNLIKLTPLNSGYYFVSYAQIKLGDLILINNEIMDYEIY